MADLFEINSEGWISQQRGREAHELVREIIQNALDTNTDLEVSINYRENSVTVRDHHESGVENLDELWTVFGGDKKGDPSKRGRYGRGMKEAVGGTDSVVVVTTAGKVEFDVENRERFTSDDETTEVGTKVKAHRQDWSPQDLNGVENFIERLWLPEGIELELEIVQKNATYSRTITPDEPDRQYETRLKTVILDSDGVMKETRRNTSVRVKKDSNGGIYEMGIPVTTSEEFDYILDVQQKIPMAEQREEPKGDYREKLVATFFNNCLDMLSQTKLKSDWVVNNIHNFKVDRSTQEEYVKRRYPARFSEGVAMPSDDKIDEVVRHNGYMVLGARSMTYGYRSMLEKILPSTEEIFDQLEDEIVEQEQDTTEKQEEFLAFVNREVVRKLGIDVDIEFASIEAKPDTRARYDHSDRTIRLNTANRDWNKANAENIGIILHELAHSDGETSHDLDFIHNLQNLAGEYVVKSAQGL